MLTYDFLEGNLFHVFEYLVDWLKMSLFTIALYLSRCLRQFTMLGNSIFRNWQQWLDKYPSPHFYYSIMMRMSVSAHMYKMGLMNTPYCPSPVTLPSHC